MEKRRVVVTGVGTVNPLGNSVAESWQRLLRGESGLATATGFPLEGYTSTVLGQVKNFDYRQHYQPKSLGRAKRLDTFVHYAQAALKEALAQAGASVLAIPERVGICLGTGIGGMNVNRQQTGIYHQKGHRRLSPFYIPTFIGNMASGYLSIEHQIKGPNFSVQTACASGNHALGASLMLIQNGAAEVMVSGGTEGITEPMTLAGFCNMKALSTKYNHQPPLASRPFDTGRDGFVLAEGAGVLILEEYEHAKKRGATPLAELKAVGMSGDAFDMVAPPSDGAGALQAMRQGLKVAGVSPSAINYINCHGTSTPMGDLAEAQAILQLLTDHRPARAPLITQPLSLGSTKSMTGHMIGATAAVEAIFTVMALKHGTVPPNINLFELDPATGLNHSLVNTAVQKRDLNIALSNSFGFGGHNSCAVFQKI